MKSRIRGFGLGIGLILGLGLSGCGAAEDCGLKNCGTTSKTFTVCQSQGSTATSKLYRYEYGGQTCSCDTATGPNSCDGCAIKTGTYCQQ